MVSCSNVESASDDQNSFGDPPESSSKSLFSDGEKVSAYNGPRIYKAKVQKAEFRKNEWRCFVHYLGWNKNWDDWVGMDRLMKHNEENILKQQALDKKAGVDKNTKSGRSAQTKPKSSADAKLDKEEVKNTVAKGKKRKAEFGTEAWMTFKNAQECKKTMFDRTGGEVKARGCIIIIETMNDIPEDQLVKACTEFKDSSMRNMFVAMSDTRRRQWLRSLTREVKTRDCIIIIEAMNDIPEDQFVKACTEFKDSSMRDMFVAMSDTRRRQWLRSLTC